ncbi:hypothetical protein mRhiFer1_009631 [Rhinolophus ferrumequinum]|uniref:Uncharacterized protein n=1 Tax=Rhinolophus ferrumequinum TaxID=59479 RepID=A0A7J7ZQX3_RHIFE|nr:hypothetical protein mRhiFer1_009631 [Rhinolophus ferrumequinum]
MQVWVWVSVVGVAVWPDDGFPGRWFCTRKGLSSQVRLGSSCWICLYAPPGPCLCPRRPVPTTPPPPRPDKVSFQKPLCFVSSLAQCQRASLKATFSLPSGMWSQAPADRVTGVGDLRGPCGGGQPLPESQANPCLPPYWPERLPLVPMQPPARRG